MSPEQEQGRSTANLRANALGLADVLMQGITHTAPATAVLLTIQFISSNAGVTAPLAYLVAFLIVLPLGVSLAQLAKHFPSAGGYYTYVSRTVCVLAVMKWSGREQWLERAGRGFEETTRAAGATGPKRDQSDETQRSIAS